MPQLKNMLITLSAILLVSCGSASDDSSFGGGGAGGDSNIDANSPSATSQTGNSTTGPNPVATGTTAATPQPSSSSTGPTVSTSKIRSFIWKPKSERDGNLVILVDPVRVRVEVTGDISETLSDSGPSNGKGTTARARHTGCAFGSAIVEFFDARGLPIPTSNGKLKLSIPNGCERYEF